MSLQVHLYVTVSQFLASNVRMYDNGSLKACLDGVTRLSIQSLILI